MIIVIQKKVDVIVVVFVKDVLLYVPFLVVNQMKKSFVFQEHVVQAVDQNQHKVRIVLFLSKNVSPPAKSTRILFVCSFSHSYVVVLLD